MTILCELEKIKDIIKKSIKNLELTSPRTPEIKKELRENDEKIMWLSHAINRQRTYNYFKPIIEKKKIAERYKRSQKEIRSKRKTWKGLSQAEREERNKTMKEHFQKSKLTPSSFAKKHSKKYDLSTKQIRIIIQS